MPQNTIVYPVVGTFSGLTEQGYINAGNQSLDTDWSGSSAPGSPTTGRRFLDTSVGALFKRQVYDGAGWVTFDAIDTAGHLITPYRGNWPMQTKGANVVAASALPILTDGDYFIVTGNTGIATIAARPAGAQIILEFTGTPLITAGANLILQGGAATLQIVAGDVVKLVSDNASGIWRQIGVPANQLPTGALTYLGSQTAANSATLGFTGLITATFDEYLFRVVQLRPQTDQVSLRMRVSDNAGGAYKTTGYNYVGGGSSSAGTLALSWLSQSATSILLSEDSGNTDAIGNGTSDNICGEVFISPNGASKYKVVNAQTGWGRATNTNMCHGETTGAWTAGVTAIDAVQFSFSSGNAVDGAIHCYGIRKA